MPYSEVHQFQSIKLFDTAVTLKYTQGHWKWYEWVKLNEHNVWEYCNVKVFAKPVNQPIGQHVSQPGGIT